MKQKQAKYTDKHK